MIENKQYGGTVAPSTEDLDAAKDAQLSSWANANLTNPLEGLSSSQLPPNPFVANIPNQIQTKETPYEYAMAGRPASATGINAAVNDFHLEPLENVKKYNDPNIGYNCGDTDIENEYATAHPYKNAFSKIMSGVIDGGIDLLEYSTPYVGEAMGALTLTVPTMDMLTGTPQEHNDPLNGLYNFLTK